MHSRRMHLEHKPIRMPQSKFQSHVAIEQGVHVTAIARKKVCVVKMPTDNTAVHVDFVAHVERPIHGCQHRAVQRLVSRRGVSCAEVVDHVDGTRHARVLQAREPRRHPPCQVVPRGTNVHVQSWPHGEAEVTDVLGTGGVSGNGDGAGWHVMCIGLSVISVAMESAK